MCAMMFGLMWASPEAPANEVCRPEKKYNTNGNHINLHFAYERANGSRGDETFFFPFPNNNKALDSEIMFHVNFYLPECVW